MAMKRTHVAILVERYVASIGPELKVIMRQLVALDALKGLAAPSLGQHIAGGENLPRAQLYVEALDDLRSNPTTYIYIARIFQGIDKKAERVKHLYIVMLLSGNSGVQSASKLRITQSQLESLREWLFCGCVAIDHKMLHRGVNSRSAVQSIIASALRQEVV